MKRITLDEIIIKNLFGRFDYDIDLRNGEDISILIAPNGCGKTTIFTIITFMFDPSVQGYQKVSRIPFDSCECVLSNGKSVILNSSSQKRGENHRMTSYAKTMQLEPESNIGEMSISINGETVIYGVDIDRFVVNGEIDNVSFDSDDYSSIGVEDLPPRNITKIERLEKSILIVTCILESQECYLSINYITADRLHAGNDKSQIDSSRPRRMRRDVPAETENPIEKAKTDIARLYRQIREEYADLQTKLKDELPERYLKVTEPLWGFEDFKAKWMSYVEDIEKYCKLGLLDSSETILNANKLEKYYAEKGSFLTVYLDAFSKTLKPLEEHYEKLKLFADIFNERNKITKKTITYGKSGIILKVDGAELPLSCLSSGEKNDFVMFYDLIFNSQEHGLVLIDEPEISLHIEWQQTFLDSLIDICDMNGLQAIVATHSPNIIHGHRELFAERGIEYGSKED